MPNINKTQIILVYVVHGKTGVDQEVIDSFCMIAQVTAGIIFDGRYVVGNNGEILLTGMSV